MPKYNHLIDVAFTIEGPYETIEDIPYEELLKAMKRRLDVLTKNKEPEAFGSVDVSEKD
jgi:hypothetical protein